MALIQRLDSDDPPMALTGRCLVGRSRLAHLRLAGSAASGEHASIYWSESAWHVRDLGSRNGTVVNGERLESGERRQLKQGDELRFGDRTERWTLVDAGPPQASAIHVSTGQVVVASEDMLLLPDDDEPQGCVYAGKDGWVLDVGGELSPVQDGAEISLPGGAWTLHLKRSKDGSVVTTALTSVPRMLATLEIRFAVSSDEEHVEIELAFDDGTEKLPPRAYHYMLLTLARARIEDTAEGELPEADCGWCYADELSESLRVSPEKLNVDVHRARKLFKDAGVVDAIGLLERRPENRQLRLGVGKLSVGTL